MIILFLFFNRSFILLHGPYTDLRKQPQLAALNIAFYFAISTPLCRWTDGDMEERKMNEESKQVS